MMNELAEAPWIIPLAAAFLISAIVLVNRKRKHPASKSEPAGPLPGIGDSAVPETDMLWGGDAVCRVRLTDVHLPEHSYERTVETSLLIGYSQQADICVGYDRTVSRRHCEIIREGSQLYLRNHSQSNGTLLNGCQVVDKVPLPGGSIIKMGRVELRVELCL